MTCNSSLFHTYSPCRYQSRVTIADGSFIFGCKAFVHSRSPGMSKLDPRAHKCVFIGYSTTQKGYKCFSPTLHKVFVSKDFTIFEFETYFDADPTALLQTLPEPLSQKKLYPSPEYGTCILGGPKGMQGQN